MADEQEANKSANHQKINDILQEEGASAAPEKAAFNPDLSDLLADDAPALDIAGEVNHQQALKAAEEKAQENWEKVVRLTAEMQNLERRSQRDVANAHKFALEKFINELLPIVDSLDRALEVQTNDEPAVAAMRDGVDLTLKMFLDVLAKFNVTQLNPMQESFNPELHEAMTMQETNEATPGIILQVIQKGYLLNERLIRPARVIVAKAPAE